MSTLTDLTTRIVQMLGDASVTRFSAVLLTEAVRLTLDRLDQGWPRLLTSETAVTSSGRELLIEMPPDCRYLVSVDVLRDQRVRAELEPEGEFTYQFEGEQLRLHFSGAKYPKNGDMLRITYAADYRLEGLDGAEESNLPGRYESALVSGAAGQAYLLRASKLAESYGTRPEEVTRLIELGQLRLAEFDKTLSNLKVLQEFGFPPGFRLDEADCGQRF